MRITTQIITRNFTQSLHRHLASINRYQSEISSGRKLNTPSDNPNDSMVALKVHSRIEKNNQYGRSIEDALSRLGMTENLLNDIRSATVRARDLAVTGANSTVNAQDRLNMSKEVNDLLEHVLAIANKESLDGYVFGGTKTDSDPFVAVRDSAGKITSVNAGGQITGEIKRQVGPGEPMSISPDMQGLLHGSQNLFNDLIQLRDGLATNRLDLIQESMGKLTNEIHDKVTSQVSHIGALMSGLLDRNTELENEFVQFSEMLSDVEDADIVESIVQLNQSVVAYEAALQAGNEVMRSTLIGLLR